MRHLQASRRWRMMPWNTRATESLTIIVHDMHHSVLLLFKHTFSCFSTLLDCFLVTGCWHSLPNRWNHVSSISFLWSTYAILRWQTYFLNSLVVSKYVLNPSQSLHLIRREWPLRLQMLTGFRVDVPEPRALSVPIWRQDEQCETNLFWLMISWGIILPNIYIYIYIYIIYNIDMYIYNIDMYIYICI